MTDLQPHDQPHAIAKPGALNGKLWSHPTHPPTLKVAMITHSIRTLQATLPTSEPLTLAPLSAKTKIADMRASDNSLKTMRNHLSNPSYHPRTPSELTDSQCNRPLHDTKHMLRAQDNIKCSAPVNITAQELVMTQCERGVMPMCAHDAPCAAHHSTRATDETLKRATCRPGIQQYVAEYGPAQVKLRRRPQSGKAVLSNQG